MCAYDSRKRGEVIRTLADSTQSHHAARGKFVAAHFGIFATLSAATAKLQSPRDYRDLILHSPGVHQGTTTFRAGTENHGE
jgi:hypothetical protein